MNKMTLIAAVAVVLALASMALARESTEIIGARYLGMGGCFVAVAQDQTALFANPAAIDRVDGRKMTIMGNGWGLNSKGFDVVGFGLDHRDDFEDLEDMPKEDQNKFFDEIGADINFKRMNLSISLEPFGWIQKPFGGTLFTDTRASGMAFEGTSDTPVVDAVGVQDFGGVITYAGGSESLPSLLPNRISVGASLKYINRSIYSIRETMTELAAAEGAELMNGSTVGLDVGLLYDAMPGLTAGLAVYDVFATEIEWDGDASTTSRIQPGEKQKIEPSLRVGVAYRLPLSVKHVLAPVAAFDLSEPFDGDVTFFKKVHLGVEASLFRNWFKARLGISEGYPTIGIGVWNFNYAYYAVEEGRHAGQISDRQHVITFGL